MKLTDIRRVLEERSIELTRSLGQNFLHDANQLRRIVAAAELTPTDPVLEIGPGLGPLTELLLPRVGQVLAIERDRRLVEFLQQRWPDDLRLTLVQADALEFIRRDARDWSGWKLVANLPYSVASPILVELAQSERRPERMVVTLQLEVAQRVMAQADDDGYGLLSLLLQLHYAPRAWFRIPPNCFFPKPKVGSACVTLIRRPHPSLSREEAEVFVSIVKSGFAQRRKMMRKLLRDEWGEDQLARAFERVGVPPDTRAEAVSLSKFVELARYLCPAEAPSP
jgi:16S rRNA (adenine1518-N6/adenine1519-N6)-dimethyltransferase